MRTQHAFPTALALATVMLGGDATVAGAQGTASPPELPATRTAAVAPTLAAVRVTGRIVVDGRLDEAAWRDAPHASEFTQVEPRDGAPPSLATEVRVAIDASALYVSARMHDPDPGAIVARLGRRDTPTSSDAFTVSIDSYHDHRTAFQLGVNAAGVKFDAVTSNDSPSPDASWDPVWDVATRLDSAGWTAEMRIPLSQLRFAVDTAGTWGIDFERHILRTGETVRWSWAPNSETGFASRFGHLVALGDLSTARANRLEVMPYQVTQGDFDTAADPASPFFDGRSGRFQVGADFKYGVSNALTLNGTINPDFGQVEADAAEVNVTVFETYFNERRPFFVEGASLFRFGAGSSGSIFGAPQLFYSRRIGRTPSAGAPRDAEFSEVPEVTQILGASKLSGRVAGWSIGVLDAVTARETARFRRAGEAAGRSTVEPLTNYGVVSLRRDFHGGRTGIGLMGTSVVRDIDTTSLHFLRGNAHTAGLDFYHRFGGNQYAISGTVAGSRIAGDSVAIIGAQRSSARYFQRPGQDYMTFDPSARSLSGYAVSASGGKVAGRWLVGSDISMTSPGFEINDIGFQQSADRVFTGVRTSHRWLQGGGPFRFAQAYLNASRSFNFDADRVGAGLFGGFHGQFRNYWSAGVNVVRNQSFYSDRATRGGPLLLVPPQVNVDASISTDSRRRVTASAFAFGAKNESGGHSESAGTTVTMRPSSAVSVSLQSSFTRAHSEAGYVLAFADPTATATFGRRYIMSDLDQTTADLTLRTDLALTPALTLQLYAQPFTSAVDYRQFKSFELPGGFGFREYGQDGSTLTYDADTRTYAADADGSGASPAAQFANPDFRMRSLRANMVLRWEYRAGSTVYLAWAHGRSVFDEDPTFDAVKDFGELLGDEQRNRLLLKVSYWFNP